jgi:nucleotide-binding universal stress UspA family protein
MILIAYDGSPDAQTAIEQAGALMSGTPATILTVWEPFNDVVARVGGSGLPLAPLNFDDVDQAHVEQAQRRAADGVDRARRAGLDAQPRVRRADRSIATAILAEAAESGARAIVLGTRGLTGVKSWLMGSVSHAVVQQADRPVMVVPSAEIAKARVTQPA